MMIIIITPCSQCSLRVLVGIFGLNMNTLSRSSLRQRPITIIAWKILSVSSLELLEYFYLYFVHLQLFLKRSRKQCIVRNHQIAISIVKDFSSSGQAFSSWPCICRPWVFEIFMKWNFCFNGMEFTKREKEKSSPCGGTLFFNAHLFYYLWLLSGLLAFRFILSKEQKKLFFIHRLQWISAV